LEAETHMCTPAALAVIPVNWADLATVSGWDRPTPHIVVHQNVQIPDKELPTDSRSNPRRARTHARTQLQSLCSSARVHHPLGSSSDGSCPWGGEFGLMKAAAVQSFQSFSLQSPGPRCSVQPARTANSQSSNGPTTSRQNSIPCQTCSEPCGLPLYTNTALSRFCVGILRLLSFPKIGQAAVPAI
jgi:hypothetical protein